MNRTDHCSAIDMRADVPKTVNYKNGLL